MDNLYNNYNTLELQLLFSNVITELLIELNRSKANEKTIKIDNKVNMIIKFINENLRQPLTVQDLCEKFHFSQSHLYREFYTHMKIPLMKYIRSKKILATYQLIKRGERPTKVAEMFGYIDYSTFYRQFVAVMGFSPSQDADTIIKA